MVVYRFIPCFFGFCYVSCIFIFIFFLSHRFYFIFMPPSIVPISLLLLPFSLHPTARPDLLATSYPRIFIPAIGFSSYYFRPPLVSVLLLASRFSYPMVASMVLPLLLLVRKGIIGLLLFLASSLIFFGRWSSCRVLLFPSDSATSSPAVSIDDDDDEEVLKSRRRTAFVTTLLSRPSDAVLGGGCWG